MKFDKETAIVCIICGALLLLWYTYYPSFAPDRGTVLPGQETTAPISAAPAEAALPAAKPVSAASVEASVRRSGPVKQGAAVVENDSASYSFNSSGILSEITIRTARSADGKSPLVLREPDGFEPLALTVPGWEFTGAECRKISNVSVEITRHFQEAGNSGKTFRTVQTFLLKGKTPALDCTMSFLSDKPVHLPEVLVWNGTMPPLKFLSGDEIYRDLHTAEYLKSGSSKPESSDPGVSKEEKFLRNRTDDPVIWTAAANKYFLSLLAAKKPFDGNLLKRSSCASADGSDSCFLPAQAGLIRNVLTPARYDFQFYAGKKEVAQMKELPESALSAIHLAYWGWLEPICRPMLSLLNFLKKITGSYGLAIILLTVIVKLVLWPLIHRGNKSMRKLQKVQPQVKEMKEKYKDNPQLFNQKMMELYRKEGVNPLGGCFPMLLQFPVFVALYSTLDSAVELHHQSFLWAADLTRPDVVGPLIFGIGIHPLMILSTLLMILQMKLTPQGGDPVQQKMMMFMPVVMLVFFYSFPSGLTLYWCVNNILSILQMKYTQYAAKKEDEKAAAA